MYSFCQIEEQELLHARRLACYCVINWFSDVFGIMYHISKIHIWFWISLYFIHVSRLSIFWLLFLWWYYFVSYYIHIMLLYKLKLMVSKYLYIQTRNKKKKINICRLSMWKWKCTMWYILAPKNGEKWMWFWWWLIKIIKVTF